MKDLTSQLGCQIIQEYFEGRDIYMESITRDQTRYLHKGKSNKTIVTSLGQIIISRNYYQHRAGGNSIFPLDEKLGVNHEMIMPDVKEILLCSSAFNTPEESSRILSKCSFITLHPTHNIKQLGLSDLQVVVFLTKFFLGGYRRSLKTQPIHIVCRCALLVTCNQVDLLLHANSKN